MLIAVSTMAWPHCGNSMSCPHEYSVFSHPPNRLFSFFYDLFPLPLLVLSCLSPTWRPLPALHPAPLPWSFLSGFCPLAHLQLWWLPPFYLFPSWWGGGWFCYLVPLVHHQLHRPAIYVYLMGGGGGVTWSPARTPDFSVYVRPGGYCIKMVTRTLLDYVDNISLVLVMEE